MMEHMAKDLAVSVRGGKSYSHKNNPQRGAIGRGEEGLFALESHVENEQEFLHDTPQEVAHSRMKKKEAETRNVGLADES